MTNASTEQARQLLVGEGKTPLKLEYFAIEGVAEEVRIALSLADVPFDDATLTFPEWATKKPTTKYGVLPEMTLPDGQIITESKAMLRLAGEADPEGKLYPSDILKRCKVEQVLGLVNDLSGAWRPSLYIAMRPQAFGYPAGDEWDKEEKAAKVKKLREDFIADSLPRFMGYFTDLIKAAGGNAFLLGEDLTIADISAYQQIGFFQKGIADHVPKDCLDSFTEVVGWIERVASHPKVVAYKASKTK